jgi:predicted nucleic acid-binding Zn ribbon protein
MTTSSLSEEQLRQQIRVRLAQGRLLVVGGVYKSHRGTGRPCMVCRHEIEPTQVACEVDGPGVVLIAHEECYRLWREESVIWSGARAVPTCRHCGKPIPEGEHRYREPGGDAHVECRDNALRRGLP